MKATAHSSHRKRAVNLTLNAELVDPVRELTPNLSSAVESLLTEFVTREEARQLAKDEALIRTAHFWNDFNAREGSFADEHSTL